MAMRFFVCVVLMMIVSSPVRGEECVEDNHQLELLIPGSFVPFLPALQCVTPQVVRREFCVSPDRAISQYEVIDQVKSNVLGGGKRTVEQTSDQCVSVQLEGHSSDHRGSGPYYQCSQVVWVVLVILRGLSDIRLTRQKFRQPVEKETIG